MEARCRRRRLGKSQAAPPALPSPPSTGLRCGLARLAAMASGHGQGARATVGAWQALEGKTLRVAPCGVELFLSWDVHDCVSTYHTGGGRPPRDLSATLPPRRPGV